jgi:hypothetical protein
LQRKAIQQRLVAKRGQPTNFSEFIRPYAGDNLSNDDSIPAFHE